MQGAEGVLLEQGVLGAIIVLLTLAVAALWYQNQKQAKDVLEDLCDRNDALTRIIENAINKELDLASDYAEQSREFHTTLTLLSGFIREIEEERERSRQDHSNSS